MTYHIYTGYKWRPMTDDELAIMCEENIVPVKSQDPEAGEIVRETSGRAEDGRTKKEEEAE